MKSSGISTNKKIHFTVWTSGSAGAAQQVCGEQSMQSASQCTGYGEVAPLLGLAPGPWAPPTALRRLSGLGCFPLPNQETLVEQMEREGQPCDNWASGAPAILRASSRGPVPELGVGWAEQLARLSQKRHTQGRRAWEPTPANPAPNSSAVLSLLIKHLRNIEFMDVFSSSPSS